MFVLFNKFVIIAAVSASAVFAGIFFLGDREVFFKDEKVNGVNLVSTNNALAKSDLHNLTKINANWVAVVPYAFSRKDEPSVKFNHKRQWFGEKTKGIATAIKTAKDIGYQVMLKPHVWVRGDGWPGEFQLTSEEDWEIWEKDYTEYIMTYAGIADSSGVEMLCIGTEFRYVVQQRPQFWKDLISEIRTVYSGKLTYAANWDNYQNVKFWDELDFIGIDAYFPLSTEKQPSVEDLLKAWQPQKQALQEFGSSHGKPVLFTEYGYRSVEFCSKAPWETADDKQMDMTAQKNAFEALYRTFWHEQWFAGGFLWKWFPDHETAGGIADRRFTPQNKHAQQVVAKWYGK